MTAEHGNSESLTLNKFHVGILSGIFGIVCGIAGAFLYVGSYTRQIEINTELLQDQQKFNTQIVSFMGQQIEINKRLEKLLDNIEQDLEHHKDNDLAQFKTLKK